MAKKNKDEATTPAPETEQTPAPETESTETPPKTLPETAPETALETPQDAEAETEAHDENPEPESKPEEKVIKQGDFTFRATLTGVKTKATKDGLRKCLTFDSKMLRVLRDIDQYLEQDFDIEVTLTWGHYQKPDKPEAQKGEQQGELDLKTEPDAAPEQQSETTDETGATDEGGEQAPEQNSDSTQGDVPTEFVCEECSKTEETALVTIEGDAQFLICPKCKKVYSNPNYTEPEM